MKRFDCVAVRPYKTRDGQEKKQYVNIGRAVEFDDGGIKVELRSVPVGNWWDGTFNLYVPRDESHANAAPAAAKAKAAVAAIEDDTIPF